MAAAALLTVDDVPAGFTEVESDVTARWNDLLELSGQAIALRPDCEAPFESVASRVADIPPDSDGVAYADDDDEEIVQFVAALEPGVGQAIVTELADVHGRCDAYTMPVPESGTLSLSIQPVELTGLPSGEDIDVTVWERTLLSSTLRRTDTLAAYRVGDVAGLISVVGDGIGEDDAIDDDGPDDDPADDQADPDEDDDPDALTEQVLVDLITAAVTHAEEAGR